MIAKHFVPQHVFETIYEITPALLSAQGIRAVLIDLDGTMASRHAALPSDQVRPFLHAFLEAGMKVLVLSNNNVSRVRVFCESLGVPYLARATKPFGKGFAKAADMLGVPLADCAVIGDQIFTDTFGGNRAGARTFYVRSMDLGDFWIDLRHRFERGFIARGEKEMEERNK